MVKESHLNYLTYVMDLIKYEKVVFQNQYGNSHKVFNNKEGEFMYKESVYFRNYEEATLHNPYFPCQYIKEDVSKFNSYCNFKIGEDNILYENKCMNCLYNNSGEDYCKRADFLTKNTYIPDIATGENGKFNYWIEIVKSHESSLSKRNFIKEKDWIVLEIHIQQIEEAKNNVIQCYNISKVGELEYQYITNSYKLYDRLFKLIEKRNVKSYKTRMKNKRDTVSTVNKNKDVVDDVPLNSELIKYIDEIFEALGHERFKGGQGLVYSKVIEVLIKRCGIEDVTIYYKTIDKYLREIHDCSILQLDNERYPLEIINQYNLKPLKTIVHKEVSQKLFKSLKEHEQS